MSSLQKEIKSLELAIEASEKWIASRDYTLYGERSRSVELADYDYKKSLSLELVRHRVKSLVKAVEGIKNASR